MIFKYIFLFLVLSISFQACTERVDVDLEESGSAVLVVFGEITNELKPHEIHLTTSAPYFQNEQIPVVSNAVVYIHFGDEQIELVEDISRSGVYLTPSDFGGIVGQTYQLHISNVDVNSDGILEEYSAETIMKHVPPVNSVNVLYNSSWDGWEVALFSEDAADSEDYYLFKVYKNGVLFTDTISDYWTTDDKFFNGNEINGPMAQFFDEDEGEIVEVGDQITLEMGGITRKYYDYINGVQSEIEAKVPLFSGPSANVKGNISNGALGFFSVMEVSRGSTTYQGESD